MAKKPAYEAESAEVLELQVHDLQQEKSHMDIDLFQDEALDFRALNFATGPGRIWVYVRHATADKKMGSC